MVRVGQVCVSTCIAAIVKVLNEYRQEDIDAFKLLGSQFGFTGEEHDCIKWNVGSSAWAITFTNGSGQKQVSTRGLAVPRAIGGEMKTIDQFVGDKGLAMKVAIRTWNQLDKSEADRLPEA